MYREKYIYTILICKKKNILSALLAKYIQHILYIYIYLELLDAQEFEHHKKASFLDEF